MTNEELKQITKQREKRTLEYKEAWSELPSNLFETVCAFLYRDGGVIVLVPRLSYYYILQTGMLTIIRH